MTLLRNSGITCLLFAAGLAQASAVNGADLFRQKCAPCHGKNGQGNAGKKVPSLDSAKVRAMPDEELKSLISQRANGEMERKTAHRLLKQRLTPEQVDAIAAHIRGMKPAE